MAKTIFGKNKTIKQQTELVYAYADDDVDYQETKVSAVYDDKELKLKKLLQTIGIDVDGLSTEILAELKNKLINKSEKVALEKPIDLLAIKKNQTSRNIAQKYYLLLDIQHTAELRIIRNNNAYYWGNEARVILSEEVNNLSADQKTLLEFLQKVDFWKEREKFDWGKLLELARLSELPIFLKKNSGKRQIFFADSFPKLVAEIYTKENNSFYNHGEALMQTDFVLKLPEMVRENIKLTFCGKEHLIKITKNQIEIHPLSLALVKIVGRILEAGNEYYDEEDYYQNKNQAEFSWEAEFSDEEIIEINSIKLEAQKYFELKTNLPEKFEIKRFVKNSPVIVVDYDSINHNLRVQATVDYGFSKINVAHTVQKSLSGGTISFRKNSLRNRTKYHLQIEGNKIQYAVSDHSEEKKLFLLFHYDEKYGFTKNLKCLRDGSKKILHYHENHWPHIKKLNYPVEFVHDELNFSEEEFKANFDVDMNAENDWLAFDVDCYLGKDRISLADLKNYLKNKTEFIRTNDGRMLKISNWEELERFVLMLESFYQKENGKFEGRAYHAPELENIFVNSKYYSAKVAEGFKQFISEAQSGKLLEKVKLPIIADQTLRDYQKEGVHWFHFLRKYRFAGILADDMGTGKTLQALVLLEMNKIKNKPSIVVCPKTLLFNWEQEATKFFPNLKVLIIEGQPKERQKNISQLKKYDLIITSYSTIKKDNEIYLKQKIKFNYCFLDEAQFIKNHKTQNAQAVKKIDADYKLALTGTPLENSVSEIWSVFDFLMPGFLGNYNHFTKRFLTPIMKKNDAKALQDLRKKTECFMLRRTKSEVLQELPPKIEQTIISELSEAQNILYQEILANVKSEIEKAVSQKGFAKSQIHILAGLMKLRQVCNHPTLLLKNNDYTKYESAKLESFKELVTEIVSAGRKVLVFSQFTQMLDILADVLAKDKIDYAYLSGKTKNRKEIVEEFNASDQKKVFLISLRAGGTGLNLTSADNVIIFDPWWNPSVENQAIDRTHRIGQKKSVNVYRLITKGTIEEKIVKLQEKKKFLFDNLVGESKDLFKKLTWDDVRELFK